MISILTCRAIVSVVRVESAGIFHVKVRLLFRFLIFGERLRGVCFGLIAMLAIFITVVSIIGYSAFSCPLFGGYFEAIVLMHPLLEASHYSYLLVFRSCI